MRKPLVFAVFCILALPLLFSPSQNDKLIAPAPFATVALAGHTIPGQWCECGTAACICEPGELGGSSRALPNQTEKPSDQSASPIREHSRSGFDFGSAALILALSLFLWARSRA